MYEMGPGGFCSTNPDLADILGDMDFDFENFSFWDCLDPKFPDFQKSGLGQAWAGLGLSLWWNRSCMTGEPPSRPTLTDILSLL